MWRSKGPLRSPKPQEPKDPPMGEGGDQRCTSQDRGIPEALEVSLEGADHEPVRRVCPAGGQ